MLKDERRNMIIKIVNTEKFVKNLKLAELTDSTIQTIIADVNELSNSGKIVKVYGGAKAVDNIKGFTEPYEEEKLNLNTEAKEKIALLAAEQIENDDLVFIDTGTTTGWMVKNVLLNKNATYVTNGYSIAKHLMEQDLKVLIFGGEIMPTTHAIVGELTLKYVDTFNFTKSFLGMNTLFANDLYTTNFHEGMVKEKVMANSQKCYVLMDSSKFGLKNKVKIEIPRSIDLTIISDEIPQAYQNKVLKA